MSTLIDSRKALDTIPGLVWSSAPDGYISYLNQRWLEFTGWPANELPGHRWIQLIHPDDVLIRDGADLESRAVARAQLGEVRANPETLLAPVALQPKV